MHHRDLHDAVPHHHGAASGGTSACSTACTVLSVFGSHVQMPTWRLSFWASMNLSIASEDTVVSVFESCVLRGRCEGADSVACPCSTPTNPHCGIASRFPVAISAVASFVPLEAGYNDSLAFQPKVFFWCRVSHVGIHFPPVRSK